MDIQEAFDVGFEAVKNYIERSFDAFEARLVAVEARQGEKGDKGDPGEPGPRGEDGRDGKDGRDGADGFGFDDLSVEYDGARSFAMRFVQGERVKEFPFAMPVMIYRGAWSGDECYGQGDTVTWGGSMWVCNAATAAQPDDGSDGWTRAVRRGRDGKNGKDGAKGERGEAGRNGRDLMMEAAK